MRVPFRLLWILECKSFIFSSHLYPSDQSHRSSARLHRCRHVVELQLHSGLQTQVLEEHVSEWVQNEAGRAPEETHPLPEEGSSSSSSSDCGQTRCRRWRPRQGRPRGCTALLRGHLTRSPANAELISGRGTRHVTAEEKHAPGRWRGWSPATECICSPRCAASNPSP